MSVNICFEDTWFHVDHEKGVLNYDRKPLFKFMGDHFDCELLNLISNYKTMKSGHFQS